MGKEKTETLFEAEEEILKNATDIIQSNEFKSNTLFEHYQTLADNYKKLYRQSKKLIKLSDNLQKNLNLANKELEQKNQLLHERNVAIERDLKLAKQIQQHLIPKKIPEVSGIILSAIYYPMDLVGGDFYDFIHKNDNEIGILISDVSGHGLPAAFITTMLKMAFSMLHKDADNPKELISNLNEYMFDKTANNFITATYNYIDLKEKKLTHTNAGHPFPILFRKENNEIIDISAKGTILGMLKSRNYEECRINLKKEDRILFYTDGLIETTNTKDEPFGENKLHNLLIETKNLKIPDVISKIYNELNNFRGEKKFEDDIAIIIVEIK